MANETNRIGRKSIFISYNRRDARIAQAIETAIVARGSSVWLDERKISAGSEWFKDISEGIRNSGGLVVLLSRQSSPSTWVTFEYAFAMGARIPVVAVILDDSEVPAPIAHFQVIGGREGWPKVAQEIMDGIQIQSRRLASRNADAPRLMARFVEQDGAVVILKDTKPPSLCIELWIENAPIETQRVVFELADRSFDEPKWVVERHGRRESEIREFLTEMNSYGDSVIWACGKGKGSRSLWKLETKLRNALTDHYGPRPPTQIRPYLRQIKAY